MDIPPLRQPCIAVVDDEQSVRKALERILRSAGFAVRVFDSGAAFLESLADFEPSCVVLDLHMPAPNGLKVLETLQRSGKRLPIVVITADHTDQNCARVLARGARTFLQKPVDSALLLDAVHAALAV